MHNREYSASATLARNDYGESSRVSSESRLDSIVYLRLSGTVVEKAPLFLQILRLIFAVLFVALSCFK